MFRGHRPVPTGNTLQTLSAPSISGAGGAINAPRKINRGFVPIWELAHLKNGPLSGSFLNCHFERSRMVSSRTILRSRETCCPAFSSVGQGPHFSKNREGEAAR